MKYITFTGSTDKKIVGRYPQSEGVVLYGNLHELPEDQPLFKDKLVLQEPILHPKAKATSYLDIVSIIRTHFLVMSVYLIDTVTDFHLPNHTMWPLKIHHKGEPLDDYHLLHISYPSNEAVVNYKKSEFLIGKLGDWRDKSIRKPVMVNSYQEYNQLDNDLRNRDDGSEIRCNKLVLDLSNMEFDLFRLSNLPFGSHYYMSERLKNAIEAKGLTGFDFKKIEEVDPKIEVVYG